MSKVCGRRHRRKADPSSSFALLQNRRPGSHREGSECPVSPRSTGRTQLCLQHSASLRMYGQEGQESSFVQASSSRTAWLFFFFLLLIMRALSSAPAAWSVLELSAGLIKAAFTSLPPWPPQQRQEPALSRGSTARAAATLHLPLLSATQNCPDFSQKVVQRMSSLPVPTCTWPEICLDSDPSFLALEGALGPLGWQEGQCPAQGGLGGAGWCLLTQGLVFLLEMWVRVPS